MKSDLKLPQEGIYQSSCGDIFCVANLTYVEDDFYTFELIESDDPEDIDAIATDLSLDEWTSVVKKLGLKLVAPF